ncbi:UNVERIFIED_CONTAM: hypothetical protein K2H54_056726 [Gekko kuhli]
MNSRVAVFVGEAASVTEPCLSDSGSEDAWEEVEEDTEGPLQARCLFCDRFFSLPEDVFDHCSSDHTFSIEMLVHKHGLDFYGYIKLVNFIRMEKPTVECLISIRAPVPWEDEKYLKPVLEDDLLLQYVLVVVAEPGNCYQLNLSGAVPGDLLKAAWEAPAVPPGAAPDIDGVVDSASTSCSNGVTEASSLLERLKCAEHRAELAEAALASAQEDLHKMKQFAQDFVMNAEVRSSSAANAIAELQENEENVYFSSYGHYGIHEEMIKAIMLTTMLLQNVRELSGAGFSAVPRG